MSNKGKQVLLLIYSNTLLKYKFVVFILYVHFNLLFYTIIVYFYFTTLVLGIFSRANSMALWVAMSVCHFCLFAQKAMPASENLVQQIQKSSPLTRQVFFPVGLGMTVSVSPPLWSRLK